MALALALALAVVAKKAKPAPRTSSLFLLRLELLGVVVLLLYLCRSRSASSRVVGSRQGRVICSRFTWEGRRPAERDAWVAASLDARQEMLMCLSWTILTFAPTLLWLTFGHAGFDTFFLAWCLDGNPE